MNKEINNYNYKDVKPNSDISIEDVDAFEIFSSVEILDWWWKYDWVKEIDPEVIPEDYDKYKNLPLFMFDWKLWKEKTQHEIDIFITHMYLYEINLERGRLWLDKLKLDPLLTEWAWTQAEYLAKNDKRWHYWPNWKYYYERATELTKDKNYNNTWENNLLNAWFASAKSWTKRWMNSPWHKVTIIKRNWISPTHLWVGIGRNKNGSITKIVVWTAVKKEQ